MDRDKVLSQLARWHEDGEYQKIIETIEAIPQEHLDYELTCQLARAYNNLAEPGVQGKKHLQKAIELLNSVKEQGEEDALWHYRMGYALYFLDKETEALSCFQRAAELDPDDEDTQYMIEECKRIIDFYAKKKAEASARQNNKSKTKFPFHIYYT